MGAVTLEEATAQVRRHLDYGRLIPATTSCQKILTRHPKYLPAYELLGQVALNWGNYTEAASLFHRTLSADPESVAAHTGLSLIYRETGQLDGAIWHMERAFELAPSNREITTELSQLYRRRDGTMPQRIRLTRGALARLQARGGLLWQAAEESRTLLEEDSSRVDMELLLAEVLWHRDATDQAAQACGRILEQLPHCLKANLILGTVWLRSERNFEAEKLFDVAQALDPENIVAQTLLGERSPLPQRQVEIDAETIREPIEGEAQKAQAHTSIAVEETEADPPFWWRVLRKLLGG